MTIPFAALHSFALLTRRLAEQGAGRWIESPKSERVSYTDFNTSRREGASRLKSMAATTPNTTGFNVEAAKQVFRNLTTPELIEHAILHGEGKLSADGALVAYTGKYTGRTPKDKRTVREPSSEANIWWENNTAMDEAEYAALREKAQAALGTKERLYVVDAYGGADPPAPLRGGRGTRPQGPRPAPVPPTPSPTASRRSTPRRAADARPRQPP